MKIGIFAGTFDPIHNGHIEFAKTAIAETALEKVVIVAEKEPYRKKPVTGWDHRQAMIERATQSMEQVDHDYEFANQLAHQHTMQDMLNNAKNHYGENNEYWFLVGSDIFEHMHKWEDLTLGNEYGGFVVALRDTHNQIWLDQQINKLQSKVGKMNVITITNKKPHISSSKIRNSVKNNEFHDLSQKVIEYIKDHNLYK